MRFFLYNSKIDSINDKTLSITQNIPSSTTGQRYIINAEDSSGKHYFEVLYSGGIRFGLCTITSPFSYWQFYSGFKYCYSHSTGGFFYDIPTTVGCRFQIAYDLDAGKLWFGSNGTWGNNGNPITGENPTYNNISGSLSPYVEFVAIGNTQFLVTPEQWLYAPTGFSPPTEFEPIVKLVKPPKPIDITDGGAYQITGTVSELGVLGKYRVRLFDRKTSRLVREIWSGEDGTYAFRNIAYRLNGYFIVAYDHGDEPLNACVADLITPEIMP